MADETTELADDEVVLGSSPLAQYLHEIGLNDFDCFDSDQNGSNKTPMVSDKHPADDGKLDLKVILVKNLINFFTPGFDWIRKASKKDECLLDHAYQILEIMQNCNFLQDLSLMEEHEIKRRYSRRQCRRFGFAYQVPWLLLFATVAQIAIAVGFVSGTTNLSYGQKIILSFTMVILSPITIFLVWEQYVLLQVQILCQRALQTAKIVTEILDRFCQMLDKSILLIREYEIIALGITVYHPSLPVLKTGAQRRGMCCPLRICMLQSMLESFKLLKETALSLMELLPTDMKIIYKQDSISNISDSDIRSCLGIDSSMDENNIPTDALKSLICLNKAQITEILQHTALVIYKLSFEDMTTNASQSLEPIFKFIGEDFIKISSALQIIVEELQSKCAFTKDNEFRATSIPKNSRIISEKKDKLSGLMMIIDSAAIHLKSSLERLQALEGLIQNSFAACEDSENETVLDQSNSSAFEASVSAFNLNIDGARSCIEDLQSKMQPPTKTQDQQTDNQCSLDPNDKELIQLNSKVTDFSFSEPEGDLLFEGYSDPIPYSADNSEDLDLLSQQKKLNKEMKESKKIINELKAIFALKKSPAGLLPFEFVRENARMEYEADNEVKDVTEFTTEEKNDAMTTTDLTCTKINDESFHAIGTGDTETTGVEKTPFKQNCSADVLNDLTAVLNKRLQNRDFIEQTIEADTFGDSDEGTVE